MRCDQCKWWDGPRNNGWRGLFGLCSRIRHWDDICSKALEKHGVKGCGPEGSEDSWERRLQIENAAMREQGAYVQDASDYDGSLHTKAEFYCSLFEPKPE